MSTLEIILIVVLILIFADEIKEALITVAAVLTAGLTVSVMFIFGYPFWKMTEFFHRRLVRSYDERTR